MVVDNQKVLISWDLYHLTLNFKRDKGGIK